MPYRRRAAALATSALAVCCGLLLGLPATARADEIGDGLARVRGLYERGDLRGASEEIRAVTIALVLKRGAAYAPLFPPAPPGWALEPAQEPDEGRALATQMLGIGVTVERTYAQQNGDGGIEASIVVDGAMVHAAAAMASSPFAGGSGLRRIRISADTAILQQQAGSEDATLTLVRGNVLVTLNGSHLGSTDVLVALMRGFDLGKLQNPPAPR